MSGKEYDQGQEVDAPSSCGKAHVTSVQSSLEKGRNRSLHCGPPERLLNAWLANDSASIQGGLPQL